MRAILFAGLLITTIPTTTSDAPSCGEGRTPIEITTGESSGTFYVDVLPADEVPAVWIYQESNGMWPGKSAGVYVGDDVEGDLQRGGASELIPNDSEICTDASPAGPDYLLI